MKDCPFCTASPEKIFYEGPLVRGLWDAFPVSEGHALLVPRRHVADWFSASAGERSELMEAVDHARDAILARGLLPAGFNIGINAGQAAGQTVFHLHVHLIPRYSGDVPDPRGGVRYVIPSRANYLAEPEPEDRFSSRSSAEPPLTTGGGKDPLLPHLIEELDRAIQADIAVAFTMQSGLKRIAPHLQDLLARGGTLHFLTGDSNGTTEPEALIALLDFEGRVELRVYEAEAHRVSFHPKAYLLRRPGGEGVAFIGSSNLSASGLGDGVEWNYRVVGAQDPAGLKAAQQAFEQLFAHPRTQPLDRAWIDAYARRRRVSVPVPDALPPETPEPPPEPHPIQREALAALERTREVGNEAGLVVLATGLGKTWLAALDSAPFQRVLFVAHREEILQQARDTFRRIRPQARLGRYTGEEKRLDAEVLFASIQTLGKKNHLRNFAPDTFDYIVVDEFHHAAAPTYRNLLDHFTPRFLLGLTATPERTDGGDLLALCGENLVYRCDLFEGIRRDLLSPFHYFGVPDEVDYRNIPWRSTRFDPEELTNALATEARAENALDQHRKRAGKRTLAFCSSQRHADYMADFFARHGVRAVAVHSGETTAPRAGSLERLGAGDLDVVFAVDMFNEGVDVPQIDTVMMLRPTESSVLWMQQLGRGLRKTADKPHLTVIDYIGNHRIFLTKPRTLLRAGAKDGDIRDALLLVEEGGFELPPGCAVTYELEALNILRDLLRVPAAADALKAYYEDFRIRHGQRPTAAEAYHDSYDPGSIRGSYGSWLKFVRAMGGLTAEQQQAFAAAEAFLVALETTQMTKSFKMLTLLAMLQHDALPGQLSLDSLAATFGQIARRSAVLRRDVGLALDDPAQLRRLVRENPVAAWIGGRGTGGQAHFALQGEAFRATFSLSAGLRGPFQELVREIVDWRLAAYLARPTVQSDDEGPDPPPVKSTLWTSYLREQIPPQFGLAFNTGSWNQGFVAQGAHLFLLVTLEKEGLHEDFNYQDRFLSPQLFQWQSQNRTTQASTHGQMIRHHAQRGLKVHLYVRRTKTIGQKGAPFVYCGEVDFVSWDGEQPITVTWRLREPVPPSQRAALKVPVG